MQLTIKWEVRGQIPARTEIWVEISAPPVSCSQRPHNKYTNRILSLGRWDGKGEHKPLPSYTRVGGLPTTHPWLPLRLAYFIPILLYTVLVFCIHLHCSQHDFATNNHTSDDIVFKLFLMSSYWDLFCLYNCGDLWLEYYIFQWNYLNNCESSHLFWDLMRLGESGLATHPHTEATTMRLKILLLR